MDLNANYFFKFGGFVLFVILFSNTSYSQCDHLVFGEVNLGAGCVDCSYQTACETTTVTVDNNDGYCCAAGNSNSLRCKKLTVITNTTGASCMNVLAVPADNSTNWYVVDASSGACGTEDIGGGAAGIGFDIFDDGVGTIDVILCKQGTGDIDVTICSIPCCTLNDFSIPDQDYLCFENVPSPQTIDDFIGLGGTVAIDDLVGSNGCDDIVYSYVDSASPDQICTDKVFTRTHSICFCGDQYLDVVQTITISADNLPPTLEIGGFTEDPPVFDFGCVNAAPELPFELSVTNISDDCSMVDPSDLMVSDDHPGVLVSGCQYLITRTYSISDACDATASINETFTYTLNANPPTFPNGPADITLTCSSDLLPISDLDWEDDCDGTGTVQGSESGGNLDACTGGVITRTWEYTDECGLSGSHTQNITIEPINDLVWMDPPADISLNCSDAVPPAVDITYTNNESNPDCLFTGTVPAVESGSLDACGAQLTRTYQFMSACGTSIQYVQTLTIVDDEMPSFVNTPPAVVNVNCTTDIPDGQDLEWEDTCDGSGVVAFTDSGNVDLCNGGSITRTWSFTDQCGNGPITFTQEYVIAEPVFTSCDDGDPCTINDMEKLDCAGNECIPCAGVPSDCSGETTVETCDDNDPCTENDTQEIACDGSICVPCSGTLIASCSGVVDNIVLPCDDGDPCTTGDVYEVDGCDQTTECVPCAGVYNPTPDPSPPSDNIACFGGSANLSLTDCAGLATWYGDAGGNDVLYVGNDFVSEPLTADAVFYVSCSVNGCESNIVPVPVTVVESAAPELTGPDLICVGQGDAILVATPGYDTYDWGNGPGPNNTFTVSAEGTYEVTVTDIEGCITSTSFTINAATLPEVDIAGSNTFCIGGSATLSVPAGFASYIWAPNGETTNEINVTNAGTYEVTVTDQNGCTDSASLTVTEAESLMPQISGDFSICEGSTGEITVGSGYAIVEWAPNGESTESITVDQAQTYSVTVTDADGCSGTATIDIEVTMNPVPTIDGPMDICSNSDITLSAGTYASYEWSNGNINESITVSEPGFYSVTVVDDNGCSGEASTEVALIPDPIVNIDGDLLICPGGVDEVMLEATAGFSNYVWSSGQSGTNIITVNAPGTYAVTVTDENGCTSETSANVIEDEAPVVNIDGNLTFCIGFSTTLTATEGFASYSWSTGATTNTIEGDAGGTYSVTVTDEDGCTNEASVTISELEELAPTLNGETDICPGEYEEFVLTLSGTYEIYDWGNGPGTVDSYTVTGPGTYGVTVTDINGCSGETSITVIENVVDDLSVSGGPNICVGETTELEAVGNFSSYIWSQGSTSSSILVMDPGTYSVTATDANGCTAEASTEIILIPDPVVNIDGDLLICPGGVDEVMLEATAGFSNYAWSNGQSGVNIITVNAPGTYSVTVTNQDGCTSEASTEVVEDEAPEVSIDGNLTFCIDFSTTLTATPGYDAYLWSTGATTNAIEGDTGGEYSVTVTDGDGCTNEASVTINELEELAPVLNGETDICPGDYEEFVLTLSGTYEIYDWGDGPGSIATYTVTEPGTYGVTVTDINGCSGETSITVMENVVDDLSISGGPNICVGETLQLDAQGNFSSYIWSEGSTSAFIFIMESGTYSVTATDDNGCTNTATITIEDFPVPDPSIDGEDNFCSGLSSTLDVGQWESYAWSTGATTSSIEVTMPGSYTVTVTDANGCTNSTSIEVIENENPEPSIEGDLMFCLNGSTDLSVSGDYVSIEWSDGSTGAMVNVPTLGEFSVTVTDANGCTASSAVTIELQDFLYPEIMGPNLVCTGSSITLTTGEFDFYEWGDGSTESTLEVTGEGTYHLTVSDVEGCTGTSVYEVIEAAPVQVEITGEEFFCAGLSTTLTAEGDLVGFIWSNGVSTQQNEISEVGTYSVTATDANGCTSTNEITITEVPNPEPTIEGEEFFCIATETTLTVGQEYVSYEWSTAETTQQITTMLPGTYSVTVTDDNGCLGSTEFVLMEFPETIVNIRGSMTFCPDGYTEVYVEGFVEVLWSTGETSDVIQVDTEGEYSVTVTDENGCTASSATMIIQQDQLYPQITGPLEYCEDGETILSAPIGFTLYEWNVDTGPSQYSITVTEPGVYEVTVTDNFGCSGESSVEVIEHENPTVDIEGEFSFCEGEQTELSATPGFDEYSWSPSGSDDTRLISTDGVWSVTVTDSNGCTASSSVVIEINPLPEPEIIGEDEICEGAINVLELYEEYESYLWSTGETTPSIEHSSFQLVYVTVTDANGCTGVADFGYGILIPEPVEISGSTTYCNGGPILDAGIYVDYVWEGPLEGYDQTIEAFEPGVYTVYVTDFYGCVSSSSVEVTVGDSLEPTITGDDTFCSGSTATLNAGVFDSYTWDGPETGVGQFLEVSTAGTYYLTVTNAEGCEGEAEFEVSELPIPVPVVTGALSICNGNSTTLSVADFQSVEWSTGQSDNSIAIANPGSYTVTVTDVNGCTGSSAVNVSSLDQPVLDILGDPVLCEGGSTSLYVTGFESYIWSSGETTSEVVVTEGGSYTVTATDAGGCTAEGIIQVSILPSVAPVIGGSTTICQGSSTILDAGSQYVSWTWSNGETSQTIEVSETGTYSVTVVNDNGCQQSAEISVTEDSSLDINIIGPSTFCAGESVTLDAGAFSSWVWDTPQGPFNTQTITVNSPGTYNVTVDNGQGCMGTGTFELGELDALTPTILGPESICVGESASLNADQTYNSYNWSNGETSPGITITNGGVYVLTVTNTEGCSGVAEFEVAATTIDAPQIQGPTEFCFGSTVTLDAGVYDSYAWSVAGATDQFITIGSPGEVFVTVTDAAGCTAVSSVTLQLIEAEEAQIIGSTSFCPGSSTSIEVAGDWTAVEWSNGETGTSITITETGNYSVTTTDANGCTSADSVEITEDSNLIIDIVASSTSICEGSTATLNVGGNFDSYEWSNGETGSSIEVSEAGVYSVMISDGAGCMGEAEIAIETSTIETPEILGVTALCAGASIVLELDQPYSTYEWSNGETGSTLEVTQPGTYAVTVSNQAGCVSEQSITISEVSIEEPVITGPSIMCENGSITLTANEFDNYLWSIPGQTGAEVEVTEAGTYTVTVSDANGCQSSTSFNVVYHQVADVQISGSTSFCVGGSTFLNVSDEWIAYEWSTGDNSQIIQISEATAITVTVTDVNGCTATGSIEVEESSSLFPEIAGDQNICPGESTELDAGFGFDSWQWSNGASGQTITVDEAGVYTVTVTDASGGCTGEGSIEIAIADIENPVLLGPEVMCAGQVEMITVGNSFEFFEWSTEELTQSIEVNQPGTYTVTVTDDAGCESVGELNIDQANAPEFEVVAVSCNNGEGTFYVTVLTEAETISNNLNMDYTDLGDDRYLFEGIDTSATFQITFGIEAIDCESILEVETPDCSCVAVADAGDDGLLSCEIEQVTIGGGLTSTGNDIEISWFDQNGDFISNEQYIDVTEPGVYTIEVANLDADCVSSDQVEVINTSIETPEILGETTICSGGSTTLELDQTYINYEWSNGETSSTIDVSEPGTYSVTVNNDEGCDAVQSITIAESIIDPVITGPSIMCENSSITLTVNEFENYSWNITGQTGPEVEITEAGTYSVTVSDANGCEASTNFEVVYYQVAEVQISGSTSFCVGGSTFLNVSDEWTGFEWSTGETDQVIEVSEASSISVTVTDANGCTAIGNIDVEESTSLFPEIAGNQNLCPGETSELDAGFGFASWEWSNGQTGQTITVDEAGTYTVTVSDTSGSCTGEGSIEITVADVEEPVLSGPELICAGQNEAISVENEFEFYEWSTEAFTQSIDVDQPGTYTVTVTNLAGCESTGELSIAQAEAPDFEILELTCNSADGTYDVTVVSEAETITNNLGIEYTELGNDKYEFAGIDTALVIQIMFGIEGIDCESVLEVESPDCNCVAIADAGELAMLSCDIEEVTIGGPLTSVGDEFEISWYDENGQFISNDQYIVVTEAGTYTIEVANFDADCVSTDQVEVEDMSNDPIAIIQANTDNLIDCETVDIDLYVEPNDDIIYNWEGPGKETQGSIFEVEQMGEVILTAVDTISGCISIDTFLVESLTAYPIVDVTAEGLINCDNEEVFISAEIIELGNELMYGWYDTNGELIEANVDSLSVSEPGTYIINVLDITNGCESVDSVVVEESYLYPELELEEAALIPCEETSITVAADIIDYDENNYEVNWTDADGNVNSDNDEIEFSQPGTYYLSVTNLISGCSVQDSILITADEKPYSIEALAVDPLCSNDNDGQILIENIEGGTGPYNYFVEELNMESESGEFNNIGAGSYTLLVEDANGCIHDTIVEINYGHEVTLTSNPLIAEIEEGESVDIELITNLDPESINSLEWDNAVGVSCTDCLMPSITSSSSQDYEIVVFDEYGCSDTTFFKLLVEEKYNVWAPNIITPGKSDLENRLFTIYTSDNIEQIDELHIFSRWGELVFSTTDIAPNKPHLGWDGTFHGEPAINDVYVWIAHYRTSDNKEHIAKGDVTVAR